MFFQSSNWLIWKVLALAAVGQAAYDIFNDQSEYGKFFTDSNCETLVTKVVPHDVDQVGNNPEFIVAGSTKSKSVVYPNYPDNCLPTSLLFVLSSTNSLHVDWVRFFDPARFKAVVGVSLPRIRRYDGVAPNIHSLDKVIILLEQASADLPSMIIILNYKNGDFLARAAFSKVGCMPPNFSAFKAEMLSSNEKETAYWVTNNFDDPAAPQQLMKMYVDIAGQSASLTSKIIPDADLRTDLGFSSIAFQGWSVFVGGSLKDSSSGTRAVPAVVVFNTDMIRNVMVSYFKGTSEQGSIDHMMAMDWANSPYVFGLIRYRDGSTQAAGEHFYVLKMGHPSATDVSSHFFKVTLPFAAVIQTIDWVHDDKQYLKFIGYKGSGSTSADVYAFASNELYAQYTNDPEKQFSPLHSNTWFNPLCDTYDCTPNIDLFGWFGHRSKGFLTSVQVGYNKVSGSAQDSKLTHFAYFKGSEGTAKQTAQFKDSGMSLTVSAALSDQVNGLANTDPSLSTHEVTFGSSQNYYEVRDPTTYGDLIDLQPYTYIQSPEDKVPADNMYGVYAIRNETNMTLGFGQPLVAVVPDSNGISIVSKGAFTDEEKVIRGLEQSSKYYHYSVGVKDKSSPAVYTIKFWYNDFEADLDPNNLAQEEESEYTLSFSEQNSCWWAKWSSYVAPSVDNGIVYNSADYYHTIYYVDGQSFNVKVSEVIFSAKSSVTECPIWYKGLFADNSGNPYSGTQFSMTGSTNDDAELSFTDNGQSETFRVKYAYKHTDGTSVAFNEHYSYQIKMVKVDCSTSKLKQTKVSQHINMQVGDGEMLVLSDVIDPAVTVDSQCSPSYSIAEVQASNADDMWFDDANAPTKVIFDQNQPGESIFKLTVIFPMSGPTTYIRMKASVCDTTFTPSPTTFTKEVPLQAGTLIIKKAAYKSAITNFDKCPPQRYKIGLRTTYEDNNIIQYESANFVGISGFNGDMELFNTGHLDFNVKDKATYEFYIHFEMLSGNNLYLPFTIQWACGYEALTIAWKATSTFFFVKGSGSQSFKVSDQWTVSSSIDGCFEEKVEAFYDDFSTGVAVETVFPVDGTETDGLALLAARADTKDERRDRDDQHRHSKTEGDQVQVHLGPQQRPDIYTPLGVRAHHLRP